jgi:hypothetical protein
MFFNNTNGSPQSKAAGHGADIALVQNPATQQQGAPVMPAPAPLPDPQVRPTATRPKFSTAYKLAILSEADACQEPGQIGALLRREGLYSSTLATFPKQRAERRLQSKTEQQKPEERREKLSTQQRDRRRLAALEKENQKLPLIVQVQKNSPRFWRSLCRRRN